MSARDPMLTSMNCGAGCDLANMRDSPNKVAVATPATGRELAAFTLATGGTAKAGVNLRGALRDGGAAEERSNRRLAGSRYVLRAAS